MFKTIAEVRAANMASGHCFFCRDTMDFFHSRIRSSLYAGTYFITSERTYDNEGTEFHVNIVSPDGSVRITGDAYPTIEAARSQAQKLAAELRKGNSGR